MELIVSEVGHVLLCLGVGVTAIMWMVQLLEYVTLAL